MKQAWLAPVYLLAFGASSREQEIAYRIAPETKLQRNLKSAYTMELESLRLTLDGEEMSTEFLGEMHMRIQHEEVRVVTDSIEAIADGRPRRLVRTFDELSGTEHMSYSNAEDQGDEESEYQSDLEGKAVLFTWNEESGEFDTSFAGEEGDSGLLEELVEDMDLRGFLPTRPVSEGDSWPVAASVFQRVLDPGGDVRLVDPDAEEGDTGEQDDQLRDNLDGTITATFAGLETEGDAHLARIALEIETLSHAEGSLSADELPEGGTGRDRSEIAFELTGELRWDLSRGHAVSLELSGTNRLTLTQTVTGRVEGESFEQEQIMLLSGESRMSMRFDRL